LSNEISKEGTTSRFVPSAVIAAAGHTGLSQTYGDALVARARPNPGVK
jgi:hypothetical protein